MRFRTLALIAATTSCDILAPNGKRSVKIDVPFCNPSPIAMTWAAVKNEGADWVYLTLKDGTATFDATSTLTIAFGNSTVTRAYSATADELRDIPCITWKPDAKFLVGSTREVGPDEQVYVTIGPASISTTSTFTVFVPDGPLDIVARTEKTATGEPYRVIVRHGVDLPLGSEIASLDFSSSEARPFESATITVDGVAGQAAFSNTFRLPGTEHDLLFGSVSQSPTRYYAVPSALLGPDDYHTFGVHAFSTRTLRELAYYYRQPRDAHVTIGPDASAPSGSVLAASPCTRLRARVPAQPEYSSFVIVGFQANYGLAGYTLVEVGITRDFLGQTPSTWTVDVPDLTRPDGSCILGPSPLSWSMQVTPQEGRIAPYLGGKGRDGEVRRWSSIGWP